MAEVEPRVSSDIRLEAPSGVEYSVHTGLPDELAMSMGEDYLLYFPPLEPYVFKADQFVLEDGKNLNSPLIDEPNLSVLFMHGEWQNGLWVPKDPWLQAQGVTITDIVLGYEKAVEDYLDVLFVCKTGSSVKTATAVDTQYPYIHPRFGQASGRVFKHAGKVTVVLNSGDTQAPVDYQGWQNRQY